SSRLSSSTKTSGWVVPRAQEGCGTLPAALEATHRAPSYRPRLGPRTYLEPVIWFTPATPGGYARRGQSSGCDERRLTGASRFGEGHVPLELGARSVGSPGRSRSGAPVRGRTARRGYGSRLASARASPPAPVEEEPGCQHRQPAARP